MTLDKIKTEYLKTKKEIRYNLLRETANDWAKCNKKQYTETYHTNITEFELGFLNFLDKKSSQSTYISVEDAIIDYFKDSSGSTFFDPK